MRIVYDKTYVLVKEIRTNIRNWRVKIRRRLPMGESLRFFQMLECKGDALVYQLVEGNVVLIAQLHQPVVIILSEPDGGCDPLFGCLNSKAVHNHTAPF